MPEVVRQDLCVSQQPAIRYILTEELATLKLIGSIVRGLMAGALVTTFINSARSFSQTWIQHLSLRIVLFCHGYIPWNYARFLDYAVELGFLQRVGNGYRFGHKRLQEYFAAQGDRCLPEA